MLENILGYRPRCTVFLAVGGGGDAATAAYLALVAARECGSRSVLASNVWERFIRDPNPGPIPLHCLEGVEPLGEYAARILAGCRAAREGYIVEPAVCRAARVTGLPSYAVDFLAGSVGVARALQDIVSLHGCEAVVAVDVGGDVLARGCEEELWSPLADSIGLAGTVESGLDAVLAVHGPGADGELQWRRVLSYISRIASRGGLLWARGISAYDVWMLEQLVDAVHTEAGRIPLLAFRGLEGRYSIRMGTRTIEVSIVTAITFFLDARAALEWAAARYVGGTTSIWEARERLNSLGVYTELDLEEDLRLLGGGKPSPDTLLEARRLGRERLPACRA